MITLLRVYKALIRPIIEYGVQVYSAASMSALSLLEPIQNECLRLAIGAYKTTPVSLLRAYSGIWPLRLRRQELTLRYGIKAKLRLHHPTHQVFSAPPRYPQRTSYSADVVARFNQYCDEFNIQLPTLFPQGPCFHPPWHSSCMTILYLITNPKHDVTDEDVVTAYYQYRDAHQQSVFLFTDGSRTNGRSGCAVFTSGTASRGASTPTPHLLRFRLPDWTSIYDAELYGVFQALLLVREQHYPNATICTDSKSVLTALANPNIPTGLLRKIRDIHDDLQQNNQTCIFLWVPSHKGIPGNERVDSEAKKALNLSEIVDYPYTIAAAQSKLKSTLQSFFFSIME